MPRYVLMPRGDGHRPGISEVSDDYVAAPDEILVDEPPAEDDVWDEGTDSLRSVTNVEKLAEAKAAKIDEIVREGVEGLGADFPGGRDQVLHVVAAGLLNLHSPQPNPPDPGLLVIAQRGEAALAMKATVESATTLEQVAAVGWDL